MKKNQILVSEAFYVTPEMKKKKLMYKINFFVALILMIVLFSYYAYAEYNKFKDEEKAKQVLASLNFSINDNEDSNVKLSDDQKVVLVDTKGELNEADIENGKRSAAEEEAWKKAKRDTTKTSPSGDNYFSIGVISIPRLNVSYAIINKTTDELLKISPTKFWGPDPNKVGNLCVVGHNYRNNKFFSKVPGLRNGDIIKVTDVTGKTVDYVVYDNYVVEPENVSATTQKTDGKREITLITCTNDSVNRVIIKAREV